MIDRLSPLISDWVWICDAAAIVRYSSRASIGLLGLKPEQLQGSSMAVCLGAERQAELTALLRQPQAFEGFVCACRAAGELPVDLQLSGIPVMLDGCDPAVLGTGRSTAGSQRPWLADMLHAIIEASPMPMLLKDCQGRYVIANQALARALGCDRDALIGKTDYDIAALGETPEAEAARLQADDRQVLAGRTPMVIPQERLTLPDGQERWFQTHKVPVELADGQLYLLGMLLDITEQQQRNRQLEAQERLLIERNERLAQANISLNYLAKQRDEESHRIEEHILDNLQARVFPQLEQLRRTRLSGAQQAHVAALESMLRRAVAGFAGKLKTNFYNFSPTEVQVAAHIRDGLRTKEIARLMGVSMRTVELHRLHIRRKLGLTSSRQNLRDALRAIQ